MALDLPACASGACLALVVILSIPHALQLTTKFSTEYRYDPLDSNLDDNENITSSKPPAALGQRILLVIAAVAGTFVALPLSTDSNPSADSQSRVVQILQFASWVFVLCQELILVTHDRCRSRYVLGCYSAWACVALGLAITGTEAWKWQQGTLRLLMSRDGAAVIVKIVATCILALTNLSMPQGPTLYRDGKAIDRRDAVSFLSRYSYAWARPILAFAARYKRLNTDDLPVVGNEVRARTLYARFTAASSSTKLWKKCLRIYWRTMVFQKFEERDAGASNQMQLWLMAAGLGASMMISSWLTSLLDWIVDLQLSLPIHEQLFAAITRKALRLKDVAVPAARSDGESAASCNGDEDEDEVEDGVPRSKHSILNLLGVDVESISEFASFNYLVLNCFLELTIAILFLVRLMGWKPTLMGCGIPVLLIPLYYILNDRYTKGEEALMEHRDRKSSVLSEAVRGIRQIKFNALEGEWYNKIMKLRVKELNLQRNVYWLDLILVGIWSFVPICMSIISLVAYIYLNGAISASVAFTAIAIFESMQFTLTILPEMLTHFLDASVSARRIERFLGLADHRDDRQSGTMISFQNATVAWPSDESHDAEGFFRLRNMHCDIPTGRLTVISGRSGSGKSLLLQTIIGEADVLEGIVVVPQPSSAEHNNQQQWIREGHMAYVSQDPWIENMTVREAILFGLPWNPSRYHEVLEACGLNQDIRSFADGDKTDIGANGINLSGGQKWRLAFARALYSRASILVLDDIFSAVDSHVGRHLYEHALTGRLCEGRTRILATHHVQLCLGGTSYSIALEGGQMVHAGPPRDSSFDTASDEVPHRPKQAEDSAAPINFSAESPRHMRRFSTSSSTSLERGRSGHDISHSESRPDHYYEEEKRETGAVKIQVFNTYIQACGGYPHWGLILFFFALTLVIYLAVPYWLSIWTRAYDEGSSTPVLMVENQLDSISIQDNVTTRLHRDSRLSFYVSIYVGLSLSSWLLEIIRYRLVMQGSLRASKVLFERFTNAILRAPLYFLDTTPVGRILNRFTADFGVLDSDLASNLSHLLHSGILVMAAIIAALVSSLAIVAFGALSLLASWSVAYLYITGAREAKRLESTARSPILEQVGSSLSGLATIRAFGKEAEFVDRTFDLINTHCQALWHRRLFSSWMSFWLSMVGTSFVTAVAIMFVGIRSLDAPLAGFALSFTLDMSADISWLLSQYAQLELDFNAAERVFEYTQLETEPQAGAPVPAAWPTKGEIEVTDLFVRYAPNLPPVLKGLSFSVRAGERIGIVGRTGAGKSSLSLALLRFLEPQSGSIQIDGVDLAKMQLHDVRSRVGIIPQDPVVFAGTVREVLDPFNRHDDDELRDALQNVVGGDDDNDHGNSPTQFESTNDIFSLSSFIAEGGRNLSQGQRQLLCLARAIVSRPKILIMDEATASVDMESDARIQRSIRQDIRDCTLLVIAHRLSTIADFDRILVLDQGTVAEFDRPAALMTKEGGIFKAMVEQSGDRTAIEQIIFGQISDAEST
ncbi:putative ABC transporter [Aspergillus tanneri]|uniref:ABC transporter domain-containing protein n=1 Tax=Aspergillus tanneri TaxID=1220188 RepID=A0A5M9MLZ7_9EURO|nr:uncharacterized protein ATNIH1004_010541 [Aspergillus tanneri]KAA8643767.1 hypothetical protein ATNIH1004_010541 [Aspergillus tanneri]